MNKYSQRNVKKKEHYFVNQGLRLNEKERESGKFPDEEKLLTFIVTSTFLEPLMFGAPMCCISSIAAIHTMSYYSS